MNRSNASITNSNNSTRAAFRRDPINNLIRIFDIAGFAMHAIGGVDLQARAGVIVHDFINAVAGQKRVQGLPNSFVHLSMQIAVSAMQMDWLIFIMLGSGEIHASQSIARGECAFNIVAFRRFLLA